MGWGGQFLERPEDGVVENKARGLQDYLFRLQLPVRLLLDLDDFNLLDGALVRCLAWQVTGSLKRVQADSQKFDFLHNFTSDLTDFGFNYPKVVIFYVGLSTFCGIFICIIQDQV